MEYWGRWQRSEGGVIMSANNAVMFLQTNDWAQRMYFCLKLEKHCCFEAKFTKKPSF